MLIEYKKLENYDLHKLHLINNPYSGEEMTLESLIKTINIAN